MKIGALILAAGLSTRMKDCKPLLNLGGQSLLGRCAGLFKNAGIDSVLAVIGHQGEKVAEEARNLGLETVINDQYHQGMFSSVQAGARMLKKDCDGFFVLPVDIPLIRPVTLGYLVKAFASTPTQVIIPVFENEKGHPPLIPSSLIPEIANHSGEDGLRFLLTRHPCRQIEVWDQGTTMDADTPEDLGKLADRLDRLSIPTRAESEALSRMLVPPEGHEHGRLVALAAQTMALALAKRGRNPDMDLLYAGGLMHDLAKGQADHGLRAAAVLTELGLTPVASVVVDHCDLAPPENELLNEAHLICLADKAVSGATLVEPEERYRQKLVRYTSDTDIQTLIRQRRERGLGLQRLFEHIVDKGLLDLLQEAGL